MATFVLIVMGWGAAIVAVSDWRRGQRPFDRITRDH
jgi:hypothetical protein